VKIRRQKRGIVMRIASVVAVSGLAIGGLFYGLNSVNAAGLNKNYNYIKANYAVPNANVAWVSPNGDDNKGNGSESAPYKSFGRAAPPPGRVAGTRTSAGAWLCPPPRRAWRDARSREWACLSV